MSLCSMVDTIILTRPVLYPTVAMRLKCICFLSVVELEAEHAQRVPGAEQGGVPPTQVKLKERQKFFEEAFQQDMEQYLSTGYLQIDHRAER